MSFNHVEDGGHDDPIVAEINVTPLTDIFLVLLIIFMVTSTALVQQGTNVNLPRAGGGATDSSGIVITATANRRIELNGEQVSLEGLAGTLRDTMLRTGERSVILRGDRDVVLEQAVQIMTIAKEAGADRIAIATAPLATDRSR